MSSKEIVRALRTLNKVCFTSVGQPQTSHRVDVGCARHPWPVYIFTAASLILAVWALMTWPWGSEEPRPRTA